MRPLYHVTSYSEQSVSVARRCGRGLEILLFSTASQMDKYDSLAGTMRDLAAGMNALVLHAPFNDLIPASIDTRIRGVTMDRFNQAFQIARRHGINAVTFHSGYFPKHYPDDVWLR